MQTGDILTLDYNEKYLLLNKVNSNNKNYFLAVGVTQDEKDIDMDDITFFEEILENNEVYVQVLGPKNRRTYVLIRQLPQNKCLACGLGQ